MAGNVVITCPECEKRFKPKADVQGKKIKCPFCAHPFAVPAPRPVKAAKADKGKPDGAKASKPKPANAKPAPEAKNAEPEDEFGENPNPYDVKQVALVPRCPNCTAEMGEHDVICLECGYNTLTRQWGKTEKTLGITFERHIKYLAPAIGAATFAIGSIIFLLYYCLVSPYHVEKTMVEFTDHESIRMWTTVVFLAWTWGAGVFCFKKFIEKPKPDELSLD
jgi:DNA-directed RNA polymerase subunit RPC12/RpoP